MFWGRTLYVDVDAQSLKEAEQLAERELLAASAVVRHARRDHSEFWRRIDASHGRRAATGSGAPLGW